MSTPMRILLVSLFASSCLFAQEMAVQQSNTTENLRGISTPARNLAWASGTHGTYLRTTDGGSTWRAAQVPGAESLDFRDVEAFSADVAYLLAAGPGKQSRIYKTVDAGKTWLLQFTNNHPKGFFDCMAFWDRDRGIAVGDPVNGKFELITTTDGGKHWKPAPPDTLPPALEGEGAFAASGTCIAVQGKRDVWFATGGKGARVFRSINAGKTWTVADTPIVHGADSTGIFSIAFRDPKHGVIAGGNYEQPEKGGPNLASTDDGGLTWKLLAVSPQWYFSGVSFMNHSGVAMRSGLADYSPPLLLVGSAHAACATNLGQESWSKIWDLNLNAVSFGPYANAIAVGPKGLIVRFTPPLQITSSPHTRSGSGFRSGRMLPQ